RRGIISIVARIHAEQRVENSSQDGHRIDAGRRANYSPAASVRIPSQAQARLDVGAVSVAKGAREAHLIVGDKRRVADGLAAEWIDEVKPVLALYYQAPAGKLALEMAELVGLVIKRCVDFVA